MGVIVVAIISGMSQAYTIKIIKQFGTSQDSQVSDKSVNSLHQSVKPFFIILK